MADDKQWAQKYILDPLTAPEPSQEDGPGTHFTRKPESRSSSSSASKASSRRPSTSKTPSVRITKSPPSYYESMSSNYPTPPASASPTRSNFHPSNPYSPSHRQSAFSGSSNTGSLRQYPTLEEPPHKGRRRGSSLGERYTGDMSHRPLEQIRKETKKADRAPHLKKKHLPGADIIDTLDKSMLGGTYHHEGPYDATLISRNTNFKNSPVAATRETNEAAIRATPTEHIRDALEKHVPLQGTAVIPPGMIGPDGKRMQYEEGADLMREEDAAGGAYKRWPGVKYLPEDYKGKGEPSFTIERALKEQKRHDHRRVLSDGNSAYEMHTSRTRPTAHRSTSTNDRLAVPGASSSGADNNLSYAQYETDMRRSNTTGNRISEGLKKRLGGLGRSKKTTDV